MDKFDIIITQVVSPCQFWVYEAPSTNMSTTISRLKNYEEELAQWINETRPNLEIPPKEGEVGPYIIKMVDSDYIELFFN